MQTSRTCSGNRRPKRLVLFVRLRIHPAIEEAIDAMLRRAIPRIAEIGMSGKLVVVDEHRIRVRG